MSGICGLWRFDGGAPEIGGLLTELERRGPDGTHQWREGAIALGHTSLATTPEALVERLPLTDAASGCTITADARLDNREELIAVLGLDAETRVIGDGELILRAYFHWGEDCPTHLLGDFAFAIYNPREQRLFCARDQMGMRQLIYHHRPGQLFVFATEADVLVGHPEVPKQINEGRIADFLDDLEGIDFTSTFFENVFRLPPAHVLIVNADRTSLRRYWELTAPPELKLGSDQAYADAFLVVFTEAVRCRLRGAGLVGSMLSGGLDSTSVAAVAGRLLADRGEPPLATFSALGPNPAACIETRSILSMVNSGAFTGTTINYSELEAIAGELARSVETVAEPFDGQMNLVRAVYLAARQRGIKIILDGMGGDLALTNGNRVAQLLRDGQFRLAVDEARSEARFWGLGQPVSLLLVKAGWAAFAPRPIRQMRRRLIERRDDRKAVSGLSNLTKPFADRVRLLQRRRLYRRALDDVSPTEIDYQLRHIVHPHTTVARERYDRVASAFGIEPRDPFLDIRLLRFCLSLPRAQLRSGGWTKIVLRRAIDSLLPADVVWRKGKTHLGLQFTSALIAWTGRWHERWIGIAPQLNGLTARIPMTADRRPVPAGDMETQNFVELLAFGCWLERHHVQDRSR